MIIVRTGDTVEAKRKKEFLIRHRVFRKITVSVSKRNTNGLNSPLVSLWFFGCLQARME